MATQNSEAHLLEVRAGFSTLHSRPHAYTHFPVKHRCSTQPDIAAAGDSAIGNVNVWLTWQHGAAQQLPAWLQSRTYPQRCTHARSSLPCQTAVDLRWLWPFDIGPGRSLLSPQPARGETSTQGCAKIMQKILWLWNRAKHKVHD